LSPEHGLFRIDLEKRRHWPEKIKSQAILFAGRGAANAPLLKNTPCPLPRPAAPNLPFKADPRQFAAYGSIDRQETKEQAKFIYG
tara:strand:- start:335 stop:589 length:255 start_codon:yes stop_codon:yes gene_type:complete